MSPILAPTVVEEPPVEPPPPPVIVSPIYGHAFTLVGGDGSVWDLCAGPIHILAGASGFGAPDPEHWWQDAQVIDGSTWKGMRYGRKEFALPLEVDGRGMASAEWHALEIAIWKALNPKNECQLIVTSPDGRSRLLDFRYSGGGDPTVDLDPLRQGNNVYPLECVAPHPFWHGNRKIETYEVDTATAFFPGPPFVFGSSHAIGRATVDNPGDMDSWPRWVIRGPYTDATVGLGDSVVTLNVPILAGESRIIDMDPAQRSIMDGFGSRKMRDASLIEFAPIPFGTSVELNVSVGGSVAGQTEVELSFDVLYLRAFS